MHYIGVRGHRGAGKSSIAYLLAHTIDLMKSLENQSMTEFLKHYDYQYDLWCKQLVDDPTITDDYNGTKVYLESFSDPIKSQIHMLLGCPSEYLYQDEYKDNIVVNFRDFTCHPRSEFSDDVLISASDLYNSIDKSIDPQPITKNVYMTLREFIMYFGLEVMQRFFGRNVWVKSLRASVVDYDNFFDIGNCYKIYMDLKTPAEATFIKQQNGLIVNVVRPGHTKGQSGLERLGRDDRIDFTVEVTGDLYSIKNQIINISKNIINIFENERSKDTENKDDN